MMLGGVDGRLTVKEVAWAWRKVRSYYRHKG